MAGINGTLVRRNRFFSWRHLNPITGKFTQETIRDEEGRKITDEHQARWRMQILAAEKFRIESMKSKAEYIQQIAEAQKLIRICRVRFKELDKAFDEHPARREGQLENKFSSIRHLVQWIQKYHPEISLLTEFSEETAGEYLSQYWKSGVSPKTYNIRLQCLKMIFKLFLKEDSPFKDYPYKQGEAEGRFAFTQEQLEAIWNILASDYRMLHKREMIVLYFLAVYTGARCGDLCQLQWKSVDLQRNILTMIPSKTKGSSGKRIEIPLAHALRIQLIAAQAWQKDEYVLPNVCKRYRYNPVGISHDTTVLLEKAGICTKSQSESPHRKLRISRYGFHSFRHCYATMLINQGVNPLVVCDLMGHTTTAMTAKYTHIVLETKAKAIDELPEISLEHKKPLTTPAESPIFSIFQKMSMEKMPLLVQYLEKNLSLQQKDDIQKLFA